MSPGTVLRVALLLLAGSGLIQAARRQPARLRATLLSVVITAALMMPGLIGAVPTLSIPVPEWLGLGTMAVAAGARDDGRVVIGLSAGASDRTRAAAVDTTITAAGTPSGHRHQPWWQWLWLAGVLVIGAREAIGFAALARIARRSGRVTDARWRHALVRAAARTGCHRRVRLRWSRHVAVPVTAGLVRPVVLLPVASGSWSDEHMEDVLCHELIHVGHHDWAVRVLARLVRLVHWFDPLAWWVLIRLETEQERACDEEVVGRGVPRSRYAAHLLATARAASRLGSLPAPALAATRRPRLEDRVMTILESSGSPRRARSSVLTAAVFAALLGTAIAAVQPTPPAERSASPELGDAVAAMRSAEVRLEPQTSRLHELEARMAPHLEQLKGLEIELDQAALADIEAQMAPYLEQLKDVAIDMAPLEEHLQEVGAAIAAIDHSQLADLEARLAPHLAELDGLRDELAPHLEKIERIHLELEPLQAQIEELTRAAEPIHGHVEEIQARLEPLQDDIQEVQREMEPVLAEIGRLSEHVDTAIQGEVESILREHLATVCEAEAPFAEAAGRVVAAGDVHVMSDQLRIDAPRAVVRTILGDLLGPHRSASQESFDAALVRATDELSQLRIQLPD